MKKTREQIIESMCWTWRHDFWLIKSQGDKFSGMTIEERDFLYKQMSQVFDNVIAKILEELEQKNQTLEDYILKLNSNKNYFGECLTFNYWDNYVDPLSTKLKNVSENCSQIKNSFSYVHDVKNSFSHVHDVLLNKNQNKFDNKEHSIKDKNQPLDLKKLQVGSRFLHKPNIYLKDLKEDIVEEWSPSKNYIKLKNSGWIEFDQFSKYNIVEILRYQEK